MRIEQHRRGLALQRFDQQRLEIGHRLPGRLRGPVMLGDRALDRRPLVDRYAYFVGYPRVDLDAMREATAELRGEHDFSAFRSAQCESPSRRRFLHALTLSEPDADNVATLEVTGNAFLRNMMRIIAGTLLDVGLGRRTPGSLAALIAGKDRREAGATLPACGLTLTAVHFDGYPRLGKPDPAGAPDDDEEGD